MSDETLGKFPGSGPWNFPKVSLVPSDSHRSMRFRHRRRLAIDGPRAAGRNAHAAAGGDREGAGRPLADDAPASSDQEGDRASGGLGRAIGPVVEQVRLG